MPSRCRLSPLAAALLAAALTLGACSPAKRTPPPAAPQRVVLTRERDAEVAWQMRGPYRFDGRLFKDEPGDATWRFRATMTFPSGGYVLGTPQVVLQESKPEFVKVTIPVTAPAADAIVTMALITETIDLDIDASDQATFQVFVAATRAK